MTNVHYAMFYDKLHSELLCVRKKTYIFKFISFKHLGWIVKLFLGSHSCRENNNQHITITTITLNKDIKQENDSAIQVRYDTSCTSIKINELRNANILYCNVERYPMVPFFAA